MARPQSAGHFTDLDGMRGVLAVTVMLFHLGLGSIVARLSHGLMPLGLWTLCVDFFFVLSGFVLYFSLQRSRPNLPHFFIKRLRRLAPMFWIGSAAMLVLHDFDVELRVILANALIVQSLSFGLLARFTYLSLDGPGWSVPFELFLPVIALPLLGPMARASRRTAILVVITFVGLAAASLMALALRHDVPLARAAAGLGLGAALACLAERLPTPPARPALVLTSFALLFVIMACAGRAPWLAALFPLATICCVYFGARTSTFLSARPFQAIGRWSYSIYLLHMPVLTLVGRTLGDTAGSALLKLLVIVATVATAALTYRFIETPLMKSRDRPAESAP